MACEKREAGNGLRAIAASLFLLVTSLLAATQIRPEPGLGPETNHDLDFEFISANEQLQNEAESEPLASDAHQEDEAPGHGADLPRAEATQRGSRYESVASLESQGKRSYQMLEAQAPSYGTCWKNALSALRMGCKHLDEDIQARLALGFTNCFLDKAGVEGWVLLASVH